MLWPCQADCIRASWRQARKCTCFLLSWGFLVSLEVHDSSMHVETNTGSVVSCQRYRSKSWLRTCHTSPSGRCGPEPEHATGPPGA